MGDAPDDCRTRLNPFAFPAETEARFILTITAGLMVSLSFGLLLRNGIFTDRGNLFSREYQSVSNSGRAAQRYSELQKANPGFVAREALTQLGVCGGVVGFFLVVASWSYRRHPKRIRRRQGLLPFSAAEHTALAAELSSAVAQSGLDEAPTVQIRPSMLSQDAQAFGVRGRYVLRLDAGMRVLLRKQPDAFRAVILHELAHIVNGDIRRTYLAEGIEAVIMWCVLFPLMAILTFLLVQNQQAESDAGRFFARNLPLAGFMILQGAAMLRVAARARAHLLRVREIYADWRASQWGAADALKAILRANVQSPPVGKISARFHPSAAERLAALEDPSRLFAATPQLAFLVGILTAWVMRGAIALVGPFALLAATGSAASNEQAVTPATGEPWWMGVGPFLVVLTIVLAAFLAIASLLSGSIGLQVQRQAIADAAIPNSNGGFAGLVYLAALLAAGLEVGSLTWLGDFSLVTVLPVCMDIPWMTLVAGLFWGWLAFVRFFTQRWLGAHTRTHNPKWQRRALSLISSGLICVLLIPAAMLRDAIHTSIGWEHFVSVSLGAAAMGTLSILGWLLVFLVGWLFVQSNRPSCPVCGSKYQAGCLAGMHCARCSSDLTPWLFTNPRVEPVPPPPLPSAGPPALPSAVLLTCPPPLPRREALPPPLPRSGS